MLNQWPRSAWWNWNANFDTIDVDTDASAEKRFEAWKQGRTGYPIVDAGMRELAGSGFMHNRVRMIVASFLVRICTCRGSGAPLVPRPTGRRRHGQQSARLAVVRGFGHRRRPYFRVFNPTAQGEKFDPAGDYVRRWVPELADVADVHKLKGGRPPGYPEPIVDHAAERTEALARYGRIG